MASHPKTSIMVISDTHGQHLSSLTECQVDVVIHCGDITDESKLEEYKTSIEVLRKLKASLKLVIAGNHDFTLDDDCYRHKINEASPDIEPHLVEQTFGRIGEAKDLLRNAGHAIHFLDEGNHQFTLGNGALLNVYASPYTCSKEASWGFQYKPDEGHNFDIAPNTDIAITHSPPKGILDRAQTRDGPRGRGCPDLFSAVAQCRPRVHCFGHIHESWGARIAGWKDDEGMEGTLTHLTAVDGGRSHVVENLASIKGSKFETEEERVQRVERASGYKDRGYCVAKLHDEHESGTRGKRAQTLFVNAAICNVEGDPLQLPWIVELELPSTKS